MLITLFRHYFFFFFFFGFHYAFRAFITPFMLLPRSALFAIDFIAAYYYRCLFSLRHTLILPP